MRLAILLSLIAGIASPQEPPKFSSGVSLVRVDVEVLHRGTPVPNLEAGHFQVKDNGETQKVLYTTRENEPLDLVLLFDVSGSMKRAVEAVAASARRALTVLRPGDRVAVASFSTDARVLLPFTEDREAVLRTIQIEVLGRAFDGWTHIVDGVNESAMLHFKENRKGCRRAVLVVTDNLGQSGKIEPKQALINLWEADAVLCGLIVSNPEEARKAKRPKKIDSLIEETGGDALPAENPGEAFQDMIERLRGRYSVYYAMPKGKAGEERAVRVSLQGVARELYPEARVLARKGYYLPESSQ